MPGKHAKQLINVAYVQQIERDCEALAAAYQELAGTAAAGRPSFGPCKS